jgi:hypothetical protein
MTDKTYLWENFTQHPPQIQETILRELELLLPHMTVKEQGETFLGAPREPMLKYLPELAYEAQVYIWKNCLPVGARDKAWPLLKPEARDKIKPRRRRQSMCLA